MSCFRERVAVVLGVSIDSGRSDTDAVKRITRYMSCSGRKCALAMLEMQWREDAAELGGVAGAIMGEPWRRSYALSGALFYLRSERYR